MSQEIKMPSAGQTTDVARIACVNIKVGDTVKRGDVLMEAETDKAVLPIESFAAGEVLAVLVAEGDDVDAGTVLAVIGKHGEGCASVASAALEVEEPVQAARLKRAERAENVEEEYLPIIKKDQKDAPMKVPVAAAQPSKAFPAMPNAKWEAHNQNIDLSDIVPANGAFITRRDVAAAAQKAAGGALTSASAEDAEYTVMPLTRMREIIGRRMHESMQTIPAWQCTTCVDMTGCITLREKFISKRGIKLSYNDLIAQAVAVAARRFPLVNARFEDGEVRIYEHTNIGLAVALDDALVVPVIKKADTMGLEQISIAFQEKISAARGNKLTPSDMGCGSITISNLGMYSVHHFTAIVNPPESCILAVGGLQVEPVWNGSTFLPVNKMYITGSFDHRIIDGAYGAQFLQEVKQLLEDPGLMLL